MRALLSVRRGGPGTLEFHDVPAPVAGPGELLIRVESCGVNYPDVLMIEDRYQVRPPRPFSPGSEVTGTIEALGADVHGFEAGDRVAALTRVGGMAELVACPASRVFKVPKGFPDAAFAILLSNYSTAYWALHNRGWITPGANVLVLGAAGGVGSAAVEVAKAAGAHVVAAVSSATKAAAALDSGADSCIVYRPTLESSALQRDLAELIIEKVGPSGADLVFDPLGGAFTEPALQAIAWGGRYLVIGFAAGIPAVPLDLPLQKGCDIVGVAVGASVMRDHAAYLRNLEALTKLQQGNLIRPRVAARYPLERAREAIAAMGDREAVGKLIVLIG